MTGTRFAFAFAFAFTLAWVAAGPGRAEEFEWETLFDGSDLEAWTLSETNAAVWKNADGVLTADNRERKQTSVIVSKTDVTDFDLHLLIRCHEGRFGLRKWRSFTLYLDQESIGTGDWVRIELSIRGKAVHLYCNGRRFDLTDTGFKGGTNHFWLMADPGARVDFKDIRVRKVEADTPDPFDQPADAGPPDLEGAEKIFSGSSLIGWDHEGPWTIENRELHGEAPADGVCWALTGRPNWADGVLAFEIQGLGAGELLTVIINIDQETQLMTKVGLPGAESIDQEAWIPVVISFRGDEVVLWIAGQRYPFERPSRFGRLGFALRPGTKIAMRDIRLLRD